MAHLLADDGVLTVRTRYTLHISSTRRLRWHVPRAHCYCVLGCRGAWHRRHGLHLNNVKYFPTCHGVSLLNWRSASIAAAPRYAAGGDPHDGGSAYRWWSGLLQRLQADTGGGAAKEISPELPPRPATTPHAALITSIHLHGRDDLAELDRVTTSTSPTSSPRRHKVCSCRVPLRSGRSSAPLPIVQTTCFVLA